MSGACPFAATVHPVGTEDPARSALAASGPLARVAAPAGGDAFVVTDAALAREVLADPRIVKDPAWAPPDWDPRVAGLEQPAAEQPALTTLDGEGHVALRRAHAPLFFPRRMRAFAPRVGEIARSLLARDEDPVDLMAEFTTTYPLTVLLELLGAPADQVPRAAAACRSMFSDDPSRAIPAFLAVADTALRPGTAATELGELLPDGATRDDLRYHLFALIFAGQLTTDAALGEVVLRLLTDPSAAGESADDVVDAALREHPPQPFSLWRFTSSDVEIDGRVLAPRTPVLVDLALASHGGPSLAFGSGPHTCVGIQLARLELRTLVEVLRADFADARLAVPAAELVRAGYGGINGHRLTSLPVRLC
jgi:cytochrome P450